MKKTEGKAWRKNVSRINLLVETLTEWLRDTGGQGEQGADGYKSLVCVSLPAVLLLHLCGSAATPASPHHMTTCSPLG